MKKRITSIAKSMVILSIGMVVGVAALYAYKKKYNPFKTKPTYSSYNDEKFLDYLYDESLVSKKHLLYPPSLDISTFKRKLGEISISDSIQLENAVDNIIFDSIVQLKPDLVKIFYHMGEYHSFAVSYASNPVKRSDTVTLYVPSSVPNSGYTTFYGQNEREQPVEEGKMLGDLFILEKAGDGVQALHNNYYNFNLNKVLPYIINMGNSYSKKYLIDALALGKYLKSNYKVFNIWGCSQGGSAALLITTLLRPTTAVVASGYSVKTLDFLWLHSNQLISTGVNKFFDPSSLPTRVNGTKLLFTFGKKEPDWYGLETENHYTQNLFKSSKNIFVKYHRGGHGWPSQLVKEFYNLSH